MAAGEDPEAASHAEIDDGGGRNGIFPRSNPARVVPWRRASKGLYLVL